MGNAQKAIMIGVGQFIAVIITSGVLLITNLGMGLVNDAKGQLSNISSSSQKQLFETYDARVMTGNDVIAAVKMYQNSDEVSIRIAVSKDKFFRTGKYAVTLASNGYTSPKPGGILTRPGQLVWEDRTGFRHDRTTYKELGNDKDTLSEIQGKDGVSGTQTYYSNIMIDEETGIIMGILFVRKGLDTINVDRDSR